MIRIILINYNSSELTIACVQSIQHSFSNCEYDYKIIIVDNASETQERNKLVFLNENKNVKIIFSEKNVGFAKANNLALQETEENDIIWFLNNDTLINEKLVKKIQQNEPKEKEALFFDMHNFEGEYCSSGSDRINLLFGNVTSCQKWLPFNFDYICGASLLIRKTADMPYWNEKYFLYYEDADYSLQLKRLRYQFRHLDNCYFQHKIFGSSNKENVINEIRQFSQVIFMKNWGISYPLFFIARSLYLLLTKNVHGLSVFYKCNKKYKQDCVAKNN